MPAQAQPRATTARQELDNIILSLQRLRDDGGGDGDGGGGCGLSSQSNGCSTYSVHCHDVAVARA